MAPGHLGPGQEPLSVTRAIFSPYPRPLHQKLGSEGWRQAPSVASPGGQDVHGRLRAPRASSSLCVCAWTLVIGLTQ